MAAKRASDAGKSKLKRKAYEQELRKLQIELCRLQDWVKHKGLRVIIVFEGRDAAGKGGTIQSHHRPGKPAGISRCRASRHRRAGKSRKCTSSATFPHFPAAGEIIIFDRSWYNRAGVEYVMGFCTEEEHRQFLNRLSGGRAVHR